MKKIGRGESFVKSQIKFSFSYTFHWAIYNLDKTSPIYHRAIYTEEKKDKAQGRKVK